jgi:hypothetical protein
MVWQAPGSARARRGVKSAPQDSTMSIETHVSPLIGLAADVISASWHLIRDG